MGPEEYLRYPPYPLSPLGRPLGLHADDRSEGLRACLGATCGVHSGPCGDACRSAVGCDVGGSAVHGDASGVSVYRDAIGCAVGSTKVVCSASNKCRERTTSLDRPTTVGVNTMRVTRIGDAVAVSRIRNTVRVRRVIE